jgi:RHS repeat-associated protein
MQHTGTAGSYDLSSDYRYGYNGKEKDDEIKGEANQIDFGERMLDVRLAIWLSVDKARSLYPSIAPYVYCANSPVQYKDEDGSIVRDKNGNIVFVEIGKTSEWQHEANPGVYYNMTIGYIFANDGTKIRVYKNTDVGVKNRQAATDCHGTSFAGGEYWIDNNQVPALLKGDGYKEVDYDNRMEGDKVIYTSTTDNVEDSKTVTKDINKVFGQGGLEETDFETEIETAWTQENEDVKVRIFRGGKDKKLKTDAEKDAFITNKVFTFPSAKTEQEGKAQFRKEISKIENRSDKLKANPKAHTVKSTKQ